MDAGTGGPDSQERARLAADAMYARDHAARASGIELLEVGPGHARMRMAVRDDMANGLDTCHGGHIFLLADTCMAYACNAYNAVAMAQTASITFVAPGRRGEVLTAAATESALAGRTGVYDVTVSGGDGRTVAVFRGVTQRIRGEVVPGLGITG